MCCNPTFGECGGEHDVIIECTYSLSLFHESDRGVFDLHTSLAARFEGTAGLFCVRRQI
jgi:hypothetical protein